MQPHPPMLFVALLHSRRVIPISLLLAILVRSEPVQTPLMLALGSFCAQIHSGGGADSQDTTAQSSADLSVCKKQRLVLDRHFLKRVVHECIIECTSIWMLKIGTQTSAEMDCVCVCVCVLYRFEKANTTG
jgi:hypothetical protein